MPDGAGQMQRRGVNADDIVHPQHQPRTIGEVLELMDVHAQLARLVGILDLHAVDFRSIAQRLDQLPERNLARVVAHARLADRPCDADLARR